MKPNLFLALVLGVAVLLTGCSSAVRLNDVPVVDHSTGGAGGAGGGAGTDANPVTGSDANGSAVSKGAVETVNIANMKGDKGDKGADAGVSALSRLVYFDYDSYAIRSEFQPVIEAQAKLLMADKSRKVVIEGHTDVRGGREYNLALGQKRAEAVRRALTLLGVSDAQLEAISYGKEKPAVLGSSEDAMEKNRRAEISSR